MRGSQKTCCCTTCVHVCYVSLSCAVVVPIPTFSNVSLMNELLRRWGAWLPPWPWAAIYHPPTRTLPSAICLIVRRKQGVDLRQGLTYRIGRQMYRSTSCYFEYNLLRKLESKQSAIRKEGPFIVAQWASCWRANDYAKLDTSKGNTREEKLSWRKMH